MTSACGLDDLQLLSCKAQESCCGFSHDQDVAPKVSLSKLTLARRQSVDECYHKHRIHSYYRPSSINLNQLNSNGSVDSSVPSLATSSQSLSSINQQPMLHHDLPRNPEIEHGPVDDEPAVVSVTALLAWLILPHAWMLM